MLLTFRGFQEITRRNKALIRGNDSELFRMMTMNGQIELQFGKSKVNLGQTNCIICDLLCLNKRKNSNEGVNVISIGNTKYSCVYILVFTYSIHR